MKRLITVMLVLAAILGIISGVKKASAVLGTKEVEEEEKVIHYLYDDIVDEGVPADRCYRFAMEFVNSNHVLTGIVRDASGKVATCDVWEDNASMNPNYVCSDGHWECIEEWKFGTEDGFVVVHFFGGTIEY